MEITLVFIPFAIYVFWWVKFGDHETGFEKDMKKYADGVQLHEAGKFDEALAYFDKQTSTNRKSAFCWLMKGKANFGLKNFNSAFFSFEQATVFDNSLSEAYFFKAKTLFFLEFYEEAIAELNKTSWFYKDQNPAVFFWKARCHKKLENLTEIKENIKKAAELGDEKANLLLISQNFSNLEDIE